MPRVYTWASHSTDLQIIIGEYIRGMAWRHEIERRKVLAVFETSTAGVSGMTISLLSPHSVVWHVKVVEWYGGSGDLLQSVMIQIQAANGDKVTKRPTSDVAYSVVGQVNVEQCGDLAEGKAFDLFQMVVAGIQEIYGPNPDSDYTLPEV